MTKAWLELQDDDTWLAVEGHITIGGPFRSNAEGWRWIERREAPPPVKSKTVFDCWKG